jgi:hypothetical protein
LWGEEWVGKKKGCEKVWLADESGSDVMPDAAKQQAVVHRYAVNHQITEKKIPSSEQREVNSPMVYLLEIPTDSREGHRRSSTLFGYERKKSDAISNAITERWGYHTLVRETTIH